MSIFFVLTLILCIVSAIIGSEILLKGRRLQSSVRRIIPIHCILALFSLLAGLCFDYHHPIVLALFWCGYFLTWFGIRSHLESSILLNMLVQLKNQSSPLLEKELVTVYLNTYGPNERIIELQESGLLMDQPHGLAITPSGRTLIKIITFLGRQ